MNMQNLYSDLMNLVQQSEAFYFVDHVIDGKTFRVFTYRLTSYTEFCLPNALECRGHTFLLDGDSVELVCLPPTKFFNAFENPMVMDLDFSKVKLAMDKLDGSLISTVKDLSVPGGFRLKSKTSFTSAQAIEAEKLLQQDQLLFSMVCNLVEHNYCVNFEYVSPTNMIVIGYEKAQLRVLNIRDMDSGVTFYPDEIWSTMLFLRSYLVDFTTDFNKTYEEVLAMEGIEGFVLVFEDGRVCKVKTEEYVRKHAIRSNLNTIKNIYELVLSTNDDDLQSISKGIENLEGVISDVKKILNHVMADIQKNIYEIYSNDKFLSRKDFAIKHKDNEQFSLLMSLYSGKEINLNFYLIKNYEKYKSLLSDCESRLHTL